MAVHYDRLHSQGIRVRVIDSKVNGPFRAIVSCGVTGKGLGCVEKCHTVKEAVGSWKAHARKFTY